jgi:PAS domain S-box-containing protein
VDRSSNGAGRRLHESLVEVMADAVVGTDLQYRVTLWNPAAEQLYGYSAEEAMGRPARDLASYEGDTSRLRLEAALDRDGIAHAEFRARTKSGVWRDVELIVTAVRDEAGDPFGYLGIHRDVSARKHAELEHRRLSALVQASHDFIGVSDLDGQPLFLNEAGQRLAGLNGMEEVRARHIADFVAPEGRADLRDELLPRVLADGRAACELDFVDLRTGERVPVSWDAFRIDDPDTGEPLALATISRDLRERRRAQQEIEDYRRRIDTVFGSISDAFYALDRDFRFIYLNDRAVQVLGDLLDEPLSLEDFLGNEVFAMFPGIVETDTERNFRLALAERRAITYEYLYPPRSRWFDIRVYPSDDGLAVYFIDIDDRKAAEALRRRQTLQQAAVAELGVRASRGADAVALMEEAVAVVSRTLEVEFVAVAELVEESSRMLLRAGAGWRPGEVGAHSAGTGRDSLVGYAVETGAPLVCEDVTLEDRCRPSELILSHGVTSAAVVPILGRRSAFGAFGVFSRERRRFDADEINFLRAIANVLHSAIERAQLAERLRDVRDIERRRLARELHDETLQELALALARAGSPPPGSGGVDDELVARLTRVGEQVREAIHDLRLGAPRDQSFATLIVELVDLHRPRLPDVDCVVAPDLPEDLPRDVSVNLLRVLGEALTNAGRHASASRVEVRVGLDGPTLVAAVCDDGTGIDVLRPPGASGGHGIPGMRERAELLGGELCVERPPEGGTLVELRVPLPQRRAPADRVRVLLVEDHAAIREALALAFAQDDEFTVTGQAGSLSEARGMLDGVDVAIVDLELPDGDGADLVEELRGRADPIQTLILSAHADRASVARAVQKGAAAVLSKTTHLHEVVSAVRRVRAGETLMPLDEVVDLLRFAGRVREAELDERRLIETLTPREVEVLQLLAAGLDSSAIARRLHIAPRTQRNHVSNILAKLEVHSQLQAVVFGLRHGVVQVPLGPAVV